MTNEEPEMLHYERSRILEILRDLELMVVSLDRIGSEYLPLPGRKSEEEINEMLADFIFSWKVLRRLAKARGVLSEAFSDELGEDDMGELEREFQDLQYWSRNNTEPGPKAYLPIDEEE